MPLSELQTNFGVLQIDTENSATGLVTEHVFKADTKWGKCVTLLRKHKVFDVACCA